MPSIDFANVAFSVEQGDLVLRAVAPASGTVYRHACPGADFATIAGAIDQAGHAGVTRSDLHAQTGIPWTRIQVALVFLNERSIVERTGKRGAVYSPASRSALEDAMCEYHALREGEAQEPPPDADPAPDPPPAA